MDPLDADVFLSLSADGDLFPSPCVVVGGVPMVLYGLNPWKLQKTSESIVPIGSFILPRM